MEEREKNASSAATAEANFDYMFKVLVIGNVEVGKTAFLRRLCDRDFQPSYMSTVGIDFRNKTVVRDDKRIKLQIWDTAGQERYRTITTVYYRGAMGFIMMFDVTSTASFQAVREWVASVRRQSVFGEDTPVVLVGNKCDLAERRTTSQEEARKLVRSLGLTAYFETSAKDNVNVEATLGVLVDRILEMLTEIARRNPVFQVHRQTDVNLVAPAPVQCVQQVQNSHCSC